MSDFSYLVSAQPGTESVGQLASAGLTASQRAAQSQANADKARDIWRKRKLQSIMSKHADASGQVVNPDALFAEAAASDLIPEARQALEAQALASRENQANLAQASLGLQSLGMRPVDSVAATQPGAPVMDSSAVMGAEDRIRQNAAAFGVNPDEAVGRSSGAAPANQVDGVRIAGSLPQMPAEGLGVGESRNRNYLSRALAQEPDLAAGMEGLGMGAGGVGAQVDPVKLGDKDPRYVATVKDFAMRTGLAPRDATLEQIAGAMDAYNGLKSSQITESIKPPTAFRGKDGRIDMGAWLGHLAEKRGELAKVRLETATEQEKRGTEYSQQAQGLQATENATTAAQNAAQEKNAQRQAIGGVVANANKATGLNLDPAKFADQKEAAEMAGRVITAKRAVDLLEQPDFLTGSWNKKLTEMNAIKGAMQQIDKIPGTDAGEHILVNMLFPDMTTSDMVRLGLLGEKGGLTETGIKWLSTQATNVSADQIKKNAKAMIQHSAILQADVDKYRAGKEGPQNYGFARPETVANPFAGAPEPKREERRPTPAEIAKMSPKDALEAKRRAFAEKKAKKTEKPARRKATAEDF